MANQEGSKYRQYDPPDGVVAVGTHVEIELVDRQGDAERLAFDIVPDEAANFEAGFLSASAPLARALMGRGPGSAVSYRMGDLVEARIVSVFRSSRSADLGAAAARDAATREAVDRAAVEETIQLALTFSSKWGDYDPAPLEPHDTEEAEE